MKTLYNIIQNNNVEPVNSNIDGHIHLFDHNGFINKSLIDTSKKCVCFADIAFRYLEQYKHGEIVKYYDNFIKHYYNPTKHILLATGVTSNEIIDIYKKYPQFIKGFGELKCYSKWKEGKLPYGNLRWIKPLLEFNKDIKLPVYIHYNLDNKSSRQKFEELLKEYSDFPIVLCHAGMVENFDNNIIHNFIRDLISRYNNLYVDISTIKTREFYINNPGKLLELNANRIIIGSDVNPIISDVIDKPIDFVNNCYNQVDELHKYGKFDKAINKIFNISNNKSDMLIDLYRKNFNKFERHCKIHLLTRGNLIGMFSPKLLRKELKHNATTLNIILDKFDNDNDSILNDYVLIGYESDDRKRKIGELFKSVNDDYKKFLCLITILEMTYTFQRVDLLKFIDINRIKSILNNNIELIKTCITVDEYNFRNFASTKYINAVFFIKNLSTTFDELKDVISNDFLQELVNNFVKLYNNKPNITTIYGLTHILIGGSDFYTKKLDNLYSPIIELLNECICNNNTFNKLTLDLQMELSLCCKLFGNASLVNMDKYVTLDNLEENEHTNMLYILLNKYSIR